MADNKLIIFAGPCVIEGYNKTYDVASVLKEFVTPFSDRVRFAFKASYDKANRTKLDAYRGVGREKGLEILSVIKNDLKMRVLTDVHSVADIDTVAQVADILQIPAFLSRQTDLIIEAAKTGKPLNIKKGQFMAPDDLKYVLEKIEKHSDAEMFVSERGHCFGYHNLVVDFPAFSIMSNFNCKVIFDASHSQQKPSLGGTSAGNNDIIPKMARAAVAYGVDGLFTEVQGNPKLAKCDGSTSLYMSQFEKMLADVLKVKELYDD